MLPNTGRYFDLSQTWKFAAINGLIWELISRKRKNWLVGEARYIDSDFYCFGYEIDSFCFLAKWVMIIFNSIKCASFSTFVSLSNISGSVFPCTGWFIQFFFLPRWSRNISPLLSPPPVDLCIQHPQLSTRPNLYRYSWLSSYHFKSV